MARKVQITAGVEPEQAEWLDNQTASNAELIRRGIEKLREEHDE